MGRHRAAATWTPARPTSGTPGSYRAPPLAAPRPPGGRDLSHFPFCPALTDGGLEQTFPGDPLLFCVFQESHARAGVPLPQAARGGRTTQLWAGVLGGPSPLPVEGGARRGAAVQGDLLSSSYCVRLGRLRSRTEYKATGSGWGGGGRRETADRGG